MALRHFLSPLPYLIERATSSTAYPHKDLSPGLYVGHATDVTRECWPDMAEVSLSFIYGLSGKATMIHTERSGRKAVVARGFLRKYSVNQFRKLLNPGNCFYINGPHTYPRVAPRLKGVKFASHIPFCMKDGHLVMYLDARESKSRFTHLNCPVYLVEDSSTLPSTTALASHEQVRSPRAPTAESQNGEQTGRSSFDSTSPLTTQNGRSAAAAGEPSPSTILHENVACARQTRAVGQGSAECVNLLDDRPSPRPTLQATSGSFPDAIKPFRKEGIIESGKVIVEGTVEQLGNETICSGPVGMTFESSIDDSFTRLLLPNLQPVAKKEMVELYESGVSSSTGCYRPPVMPYNGLPAHTPDLATAEALIGIRPLRLDNLYICVDGGVWTIHLGDDSATDGLEWKVIVHLTDVEYLRDMGGAKKDDNIRVAIRMRPFNDREKALGAKQSIVVQGNACQVIGDVPKENNKATGRAPAAGKTFFYDYAYDSTDSTAHPASNSTLYDDIGKAILDNAMDGYNGCLFAYGQTGSGKSYSMLGGSGDPGMIPRLTNALFAKVTHKDAKYPQTHVWVSYLEIYNEKIRDLLAAGDEDANEEGLAVYDKAGQGVIISGAVEAAVESLKDVKGLLDYGNAQRAVGATNMNAVSSRSHAVFTLRVQRVCSDAGGDLHSRINLVDLAGSERQAKTQSEGSRLKEGIAINQSLSTLAQVIARLSEGKGKGHVPFRNSKLTFLLKDSLSGNSKTFMIAAISPSASEVFETVSTLRFATSVKKVQTSAVQNQAAAGNVDAMKHAMEALKKQLAAKGVDDPDRIAKEKEQNEEIKKLKAELEANKQEISLMQTDFHDQLKKNKQMAKEREAYLKQKGIKHGDVVDRKHPFLLNVSSDPLLSGSLAWSLHGHHEFLVGSHKHKCAVVVRGLGVPNDEPLCKFVCPGEGKVGIQMLSEKGSVQLNGRRLKAGDKEKLHHMDNILLGKAIMVRLHLPNHREEKDLTFEQAMAQVEGQVPAELEFYFAKARERWGSASKQYKAVVGYALKELWPLVDEANEISRDLYPVRPYKYTIEVFVDHIQAEGQQSDFNPADIVNVRMARLEKPDTKNYKSVCTWSMEQLEGRVEVMREIFHKFHELSPEKRAKKCGVSVCSAVTAPQ
ncbi:hypothetical protein FOL46_006304 [Perkinsus olseni]|uniref:Kinesin motor domain-containing protein n=1 Tax=Perkinsus olseni TaxID=32597 RepID=A0A7J6MR79_PEROL|nr:hypothetical protein FOL46_006304 [Perkinsus olseni]